MMQRRMQLRRRVTEKIPDKYWTQPEMEKKEKKQLRKKENFALSLSAT